MGRERSEGLDRLVMYRDDSDVIRLAPTLLPVEELAAMCGTLQVILGLAALKGGADIDTVKDSMLEIHLQAMRDMERQMKHLPGEEGG